MCSTTKTAFLNFGRNTHCFKCTKHKGQCNAVNVVPASPSVSAKEKAAHKKKDDRIASLEKQLASKKQEVVEEQVEEEGGDAALRTRLEGLRRDAKRLHGCENDGLQQFLSGINDEIADIEVQITQGKPLSEQSKIVQSKLAKLRKEQEGRQRGHDSDIKAYAALGEKIQKDKEWLEEKAKQIQELTTQANSLNVQRAGPAGKGEVVPGALFKVLSDEEAGAAFTQQGLGAEHLPSVLAVLRNLGVVPPGAPPGGSGAGAKQEKDEDLDEEGDFEMQWKEFVDAAGIQDDVEKKEAWITVQKKKRKTGER